MTDIHAAAVDSAGTWQTIEQAAIALGLSVRTVNRHIAAQKLTSRLMDGRREVFVPSPGETPSNNGSNAVIPDNADASTEAPPVATPAHAPTTDSQPTTPNSEAFLDLETALAMADRKADRQVELAVRAYQSLTTSIELQAQSAKRTAAVAWCIVGVLSIGMTVALVWTATRVTRTEVDSQHLKQQADLDAQRLKAQVDEADQRVDTSERQLADMQQKLSEAQQAAARAQGRAAVYEELQGRQPVTRPTSRPSLIDRLTTAFGTGQ